MSDVITRPILFTGEMVRANLDRHKTQTRRPAKALFDERLGGWATKVQKDNGGWVATFPYVNPHTGANAKRYAIGCPYGQPGDRLWVRETWGITAAENRHDFEIYDVLHGEYQILLWDVKLAYHYRASEEYPGMCWRPSIHMPRRACRTFLDVKDIWPERVQGISEGDAEAEGVDYIPLAPSALSHRTAFAGLWDKIYDSKGLGWDANPWVWAVTFKTHEGPTT